MANAKYYSPRLQLALISPLYHAAKAQRIPMTALASRLIAEGLERLERDRDQRIAEEPSASDPKRMV